jgi:hypothetical protein
MVELTDEPSACCAPEQHATCCEPNERAECCGHDKGCDCAAGAPTVETAPEREQVRGPSPVAL